MLFWSWYYLTHSTISLINACDGLVPSLGLTLFLVWCWVLILPTWTQLIHWVNRHQWAQRQRCLSDHEGSEMWRRTSECHKQVIFANISTEASFRIKDSWNVQPRFQRNHSSDVNHIVPKQYLRAVEFSLWCWSASGMLQSFWEFHKHVF